MNTINDLKSKMAVIKHTWHQGTRPGNDGEPGNTLEDLLGVAENNLKLPDFGGLVELKTHGFEGGSLLTLIHREPEPGRVVPKLLKSMGWGHQEAGREKPADEMSFRSTTYGHGFSARGFKIAIDDDNLEFIYEPSEVSRSQSDVTGNYNTYGDWADAIEERRPHYSEHFPVYYNKEYILEECFGKLDTTFLTFYKKRGPKGNRFYWYQEGFIGRGLRREMFDVLINEGALFLDFDARTGHNHGTKLRVKKSDLPRLFSEYIQVF